VKQPAPKLPAPRFQTKRCPPSSRRDPRSASPEQRGYTWDNVPELHLLTSDEKAGLVSVLSDARDRGFLGPGPVQDQMERSLGFLAFANSGTQALDLGSGGGLPGLALAMALPACCWYLVDSNQKRADWLRTAVASLGLEGRCQVVCGRAEQVSRTPLRGTFDLVTARSFGPPAATAECAAAFLRTGGDLVVAEPPTGASGRWPATGLELVGLAMGGNKVIPTAAGPVTLTRLVVTSVCPDKYPRRVGMPFKRPLF